VGRCNGLDCGVKIKVTSAVSYLCVYFVCVQNGGADSAKQKNNKNTNQYGSALQPRQLLFSF